MAEEETGKKGQKAVSLVLAALIGGAGGTGGTWAALDARLARTEGGLERAQADIAVLRTSNQELDRLARSTHEEVARANSQLDEMKTEQRSAGRDISEINLTLAALCARFNCRR